MPAAKRNPLLKLQTIVRKLALGLTVRQACAYVGVLHGRNLVVACDWARGGDDNVILVRDGNAITDICTCREKDTTKAATTIRDLGYGSKNMMIIGDATGVGGPINDQLRRRGIKIVDFNFGAKSTDPRFENEGSRIWHLVAQMIRDSKIVPPPYHQQDVKRLFEQLANRQDPGAFSFKTLSLCELFGRTFCAVSGIMSANWRDDAQLTSLSPKHSSNLVVSIIKT